MKLAEFTGVAEKLGIVISSPAQVIAIVSTADLNGAATDEIEIVMVDFTTGKELPLLRKKKIAEIRQTAAMGNLQSDPKIGLIEICDSYNLELNANKVVRINLTSLTAASTYKVFAIPTNEDSQAATEYEKMVISTGVNTQRFPVSNTSQLILPEANLSDVRIIWSNGKEQRLTSDELQIIRTANTTLAETKTVFVIDTIDEQKGLQITEIEVNLSASNGYEILRIKNLNKPGIYHEM